MTDRTVARNHARHRMLGIEMVVASMQQHDVGRVKAVDAVDVGIEKLHVLTREAAVGNGAQPTAALAGTDKLAVGVAVAEEQLPQRKDIGIEMVAALGDGVAQTHDSDVAWLRG